MSFLPRRRSESTGVPVAHASTRYRFEADSTGVFRIVDEHRGTVDIVRTRSVADYDVRQLNAGAAQVNPHAIVGCRVEVRVGRSSKSARRTR